jgi:hypothetical protein
VTQIRDASICQSSLLTSLWFHFPPFLFWPEKESKLISLGRDEPIPLWCVVSLDLFPEENYIYIKKIGWRIVNNRIFSIDRFGFVYKCIKTHIVHIIASNYIETQISVHLCCWFLSENIIIFFISFLIFYYVKVSMRCFYWPLNHVLGGISLLN